MFSWTSARDVGAEVLVFPGFGGPDRSFWMDVRRDIRPTASLGWFFVPEQRVGRFTCTLQFCDSRGARLEDLVCDSMGQNWPFFHADFGKEFPSRTLWRGPSRDCPSPSSVLCPLLQRKPYCWRRDFRRSGQRKWTWHLQKSLLCHGNNDWRVCALKACYSVSHLWSPTSSLMNFPTYIPLVALSLPYVFWLLSPACSHWLSASLPVSFLSLSEYLHTLSCLLVQSSKVNLHFSAWVVVSRDSRTEVPAKSKKEQGFGKGNLSGGEDKPWRTWKGLTQFVMMVMSSYTHMHPHPKAQTETSQTKSSQWCASEIGISLSWVVLVSLTVSLLASWELGH